MTGEHAIEIHGLCKTYSTGQEVLRGLELEVPRGSVFGLLGRNGAGKTTAIRTLMGLIRPSAGLVQVLGDRSSPLSVETRQRIGYLSQDQRMFSWMDLEQLIGFTSSFYPRWDRRYADELIDRLDLPLGIPFSAFSRGEQQKAGLLLALGHRPELLILDEPAASLDTVVRREFLESVLDLLTREGATVLISSQILTDIERIADWIGILSEGRMLVAAPLDDLKESIKRLRIRFDEGPPPPVEVPGAISSRCHGREVLVTVDCFEPGIIDTLKKRYNATVEVQNVDLEEIFIELVG